MTRIYNLELQKLKKINDKYLEENKDELNKAILKRGSKVTIKIDKLEYHHGSSIKMNMDDLTYRYFDPEGKSKIEAGIYNMTGRVIIDDLTIDTNGIKEKNGFIDTDVEITIKVYDNEQPKLGKVGNYSIFNKKEEKKQICFHLDIPRETYNYLDAVRNSNDELEFFAQVELPRKDEVDYVLPIGTKPDIQGKVYKSVFRSIHSFGKKK